jgi:hypothetical protein
MNEDYLWDRSGEPDADIVHLEHVLGDLRWSKTQRDFTLTTPVRRQRRQRAWWTAAAAAVLVLGVGTALVVRRTQTIGPVTSWQLSLAGGKPSAVRAGQVIETAGIPHATMGSDLIGEVDIEPDSRLRLLAARTDEQRLALDHGTIHARIWAPPAEFVVDTPSAKTVDLGCQYTLRVTKDGVGFLTVNMGWVAFQSHGIESFIPAGAACTTRPGHGPDTPYFLDAPEALTQALTQFDSTGSNKALNIALAAARPQDGLTLWHLLQRTHAKERSDVYDRFASLITLPSNITREAILRGDRNSIDAAWNALQLGDTSWWRKWKRQW